MKFSEVRFHLAFWRAEFRRRFAQRIADMLSADANALVVRALEIEGQPHEVDLTIPDPKLSQFLVSSHILSEPILLHIPAQNDILTVDGHWWPPVRVFELKGVQLDVASGLSFADGRVVSQSGSGHRWSRDAAFITGAFRRVKAQRMTEMSRPIASLGQTTNYYHFLIETLPRILRILSVAPEVTFLTSGEVPDFALEILEFAGIENRIMINNDVIAANDLWICEPSPLFFPHPEDLRLVSAKLTDATSHEQSTDLSASELVYISRSKSSRSLQCETDLENHLLKQGFDVLHLETLPIHEQIVRLQAAKVVVSPHGAGLSNILFLSKDARVIELSSGEWWWPCFRRMSGGLGLGYELIVLPSSPSAPHGSASDAIQMLDAVLSLKK